MDSFEMLQKENDDLKVKIKDLQKLREKERQEHHNEIMKLKVLIAYHRSNEEKLLLNSDIQFCESCNTPFI